MIILKNNIQTLIEVDFEYNTFNIAFMNANIQRFLGRIEFNKAEALTSILLNLYNDLEILFHGIDSSNSHERIEKAKLLFKTRLNDIAIQYKLQVEEI